MTTPNMVANDPNEWEAAPLGDLFELFELTEEQEAAIEAEFPESIAASGAPGWLTEIETSEDGVVFDVGVGGLPGTVTYREAADPEWGNHALVVTDAGWPVASIVWRPIDGGIEGLFVSDFELMVELIELAYEVAVELGDAPPNLDVEVNDITYSVFGGPGSGPRPGFKRPREPQITAPQINEEMAASVRRQWFETWRSSYNETAERTSAKGVPVPPVKEVLAEVARQLKAEAEGPLVMHAPLGAVMDIVQDKGFLSQHDTGSSEGFFDPEYRAKRENEMFGTKPDGSLVKPVYGAIDRTMSGVQGSGAEDYGNVQFVFKDEVRDRTTVTFGDSLDADAAPMPANYDGTDPNVVLGASAGALEQPSVRDQYIANAINSLNGEVPAAPLASSYAETQIQGRLTLDDVKEVRFVPWTTPKQRENAMFYLDKAGIQVGEDAVSSRYEE